MYVQQVVFSLKSDLVKLPLEVPKRLALLLFKTEEGGHHLLGVFPHQKFCINTCMI